MPGSYSSWIHSMNPFSWFSSPSQEKKLDPKEYANQQRKKEIAFTVSNVLICAVAAGMVTRSREDKSPNAETLFFALLGGILGGVFSVGAVKQERRQLLTNLSSDLEGLLNAIERHIEELSCSVDNLNRDKIKELAAWAFGHTFEGKTADPALADSWARKRLLDALDDLLQRQIEHVGVSSKKIVCLWNEGLPDLQEQLVNRAVFKA